MSAYLSLLAMHVWDNTILDEMKPYLPTYAGRNMEAEAVQWPDIDFKVLKENLLLETAELDTIYADPDFMKQAVRIWSAKQSRYWQEYYNTTIYKYNAIWNKDGTITRTETESRDLAKTESETGNSNEKTEQSINQTGTIDQTDTVAGSGTSESTVTETPNTTDTTTRSGTAFNTDALATREKDVLERTGTNTTVSEGGTSNDSTTTQKGTTTQEGSGTITENGTSVRNSTAKDSGTITRTYSDVEQGNIGVTMTQDMIMKQRDILVNIYDFIINDFKNRFCLLVY